MFFPCSFQTERYQSNRNSQEHFLTLNLLLFAIAVTTAISSSLTFVLAPAHPSKLIHANHSSSVSPESFFVYFEPCACHVIRSEIHPPLSSKPKEIWSQRKGPVNSLRSNFRVVVTFIATNEHASDEVDVFQQREHLFGIAVAFVTVRSSAHCRVSSQFP